MVKQLNETGRVVWTLPGGGVEPYETAEMAAIRELAEETRLVGRVVRRLADGPDAIFLVEVDDDLEPVVGAEDELFEVAWRLLTEVKEDRQVRLVLAAL